MGPSILIGLALIVVCVLIHALTTQVCMNLQKKYKAKNKKATIWNKTRWVSIIVFVVFLASMIEAVIWALAYNWLGALDSFSKATYFSLVTYTTLGYGDIILNDEWRLLASFQAANGVIIFGWSTAIVMAVVQKMFSSAND